MKSLRGQIVLITGAGGNLGQAITRAFLRAGSHVILADLSAERLRHLVDAGAMAYSEREAVGTVLGCVSADLSTSTGCDQLYQRSRGISPRIDILVNNAAVSVFSHFNDIDEALWEKLLQVDLLAPMRITGKILPDMIARGSGHLVNVSSTSGLMGFAGYAPYSAAKFGLRGFADALYAEVWSYGIDVTTVYPSFLGRAMGQQQPPPDRATENATLLRLFGKYLVSDADFVATELLKGIQKRRRHVYPGTISKLIDGVHRFAPWVSPLNRFRGFEFARRASARARNRPHHANSSPSQGTSESPAASLDGRRAR